VLRADYYRNSVVRIIEGPGAEEDQIVRAFAVSTRFLDTERSFAVAPVASQSLYSFVPALPEEFHDLLVYEAVNVALASVDHSEGQAANDRVRLPRLQEFRESVDRRQSAEPAGVNVTQETNLAGEI
jgi:hypothetical protein